MIIPFIDFSGQLPLVRLFLKNGEQGYALIDSGSESTILDPIIMKDYPGLVISSTIIGQQNNVGFAGKANVKVVRANLHLPFNSTPKKQFDIILNCSVADLSSISSRIEQRFGVSGNLLMILGCDFLTAVEAKIDMKKRHISVIPPVLDTTKNLKEKAESPEVV